MTRTRRPQIGILGGTFNPIHLGHLLIAQDALEEAKLDCVKFIPAATPPHKPLAGAVTAAQRLQMVRLAIRGNDRFAVDDLEIRRGGKSYSIATLTELRQREPGADFHFIIGADSLAELATWKEIERLATMCAFVVVGRPGFEQARTTVQSRQRWVAGHECAIASRDIRARRARGLSIRYLVPEAVFRYIARQKLYL